MAHNQQVAEVKFELKQPDAKAHGINYYDL